MTLAHPAWLLLLILIPILGWVALGMRRRRSRQLSLMVAARLRDQLLRRGASWPHWLAFGSLLVACGLMVIAMARPRADSGMRSEKSVGKNLLIALDLSRSMRTRDVTPDRLGHAKTVIYELLEALPNERVGLIGFAGTPYLFAPLTIDHQAVRETVEQVDESWVPLGGSDIVAALKLAIDTLKKTGQKNHALVILSDGENHAKRLEPVLKEALEAGIYILAIGVGTEDGAYVPNADFPNERMVERGGKPVISRLQPEFLRRLAKESRGRYAVAGGGADVPGLVASVMKDLENVEIEGRQRRVWIEFYQWLLLPAVLLLMLALIAGTRWRGLRAHPVAAILIGMACLCPMPAKAGLLEDARQAWQSRQYPDLRDKCHALASRTLIPSWRARYQLGEAWAWYKLHDFPAARTAFSRVLTSKDPAIRGVAADGMGNTLFQTGWMRLADNPYGSSGTPTDLKAFDVMVKKALAANDSAEGQDNTGDSLMEEVIINWVDAIRHYDSVISLDPNAREANHNRELVRTYLKRLEELLKEQQQKSEQEMSQMGPPPPQPSEDPPSKEPGDGDKPPPDDQTPKRPGDRPSPPKDPNKDDGGSREPREKPPAQGDQPEPAPGKAGESPEERARRILEENADLEKGPLTPGRIELRQPEKDW